jgi:hypothetical protein
MAVQPWMGRHTRAAGAGLAAPGPPADRPRHHDLRTGGDKGHEVGHHLCKGAAADDDGRVGIRVIQQLLCPLPNKKNSYIGAEIRDGNG